MLHLDYLCAGKLILQFNPPSLDRNESHFPRSTIRRLNLKPHLGIHFPPDHLYDMVNLHIHDIDHVTLVKGVHPDDPIVELQFTLLICRTADYNTHDLGRAIILRLEQGANSHKGVGHSRPEPLHFPGAHVVCMWVMSCSYRT